LPTLAQNLHIQFKAKGWDHPILNEITSLIKARCNPTPQAPTMSQ